MDLTSGAWTPVSGWGGEVGVGTGIVAEIRGLVSSCPISGTCASARSSKYQIQCRPQHNQPEACRLRALSEARAHAHVPSHGPHSTAGPLPPLTSVQTHFARPASALRSSLLASPPPANFRGSRPPRPEHFPS